MLLWVYINERVKKGSTRPAQRIILDLDEPSTVFGCLSLTLIKGSAFNRRLTLYMITAVVLSFAVSSPCESEYGDYRTLKYI